MSDKEMLTTLRELSDYLLYRYMAVDDDSSLKESYYRYMDAVDKAREILEDVGRNRPCGDCQEFTCEGCEYS